MFALDMPNIPPHYAPVVITASSQVREGSTSHNRTIGICHVAENRDDRPPSNINSIEPISEVWGYLQKHEGRAVDISVDMKTAKVNVLQVPEHGVLRDDGSGGYRYIPLPNYIGKDRATLLVEIGGLKVKVVYFFKVLIYVGPGSEEYDPYGDKNNCPNGYQWRIPPAPANAHS